MIFGPGEKLVPGLFEGAWKSMHFEKEFGPRISGSIRTSSPVEAGGLTCAFDVTFDAAVVDFK